MDLPTTRLDQETIIWLTTVRSDGQPQTSPVGFLWDGERFLILSQPGAPKVKNLRTNPKVSLHLDMDATSEGASVVTLEGVGELDPAPLTDGEKAAYTERYNEDIASSGMTPDGVYAKYSTVIRVTPVRVRTE